jgi:hypothetical protein
MKKFGVILEIFGILVAASIILLSNTTQYPFVLNLAPTYKKEQRAYDDFFRRYKTYHTPADSYFKDFEALVIRGLANLDPPEIRVKIVPGSITQFEYVNRPTPTSYDVEGDSLSNWVRIHPQRISWNKANIERALKRDFDASIGKYNLFGNWGAVIIIAVGMMLDKEVVPRILKRVRAHKRASTSETPPAKQGAF